MPRLLIHVEGQTEEDFVNEVLREHLRLRGFDSVDARIFGNARLRQQCGGVRPWPSVRRDIARHLKQDQLCFATTMVDFYGLPQGAEKGWPGRDTAQGSSIEKATHVEAAIHASLMLELGPNFRPQCFVPFVVMHEFEGLLFSDCIAFGAGIGRPDLSPSFQAVRDRFGTPEDINDSPETAPSKRIRDILNGRYEKPLFGVLGILEIGLNRIRAECPHFDQWLHTLEALADS